MEKTLDLDWEQFIQNTIDAMLICDGDGLIIQANKMAADNLKIDLSELLNHKIEDLVNHGIYNNSTVLQALQSKQVITDTVMANDGRHLLSTSIPILDKDEKVIFVITNSRTTELLKTLRDKIDKIERINQNYQEAITYLNDPRKSAGNRGQPADEKHPGILRQYRQF